VVLPAIAAALAGIGVAGGVEDAFTGRRESYLGRASSAVSSWMLGGSDKKDNKGKIAALLRKGGLSDDNINGILANLQTESGLNPYATGDNGQAQGPRILNC
jgi:hypothetical protein